MYIFLKHWQNNVQTELNKNYIKVFLFEISSWMPTGSKTLKSEQKTNNSGRED